MKHVSEHNRILNSERGFTLIEVAFCVWLIAFIVVSLFKMQTGSINLINASSFNQLAPELANELISQISNDLENWSQTQGDFGHKHPKINWTCKIVDAQLDDLEYFDQENQNRFKRIDIKITHTLENRSFQVFCWRLVNE